MIIPTFRSISYQKDIYLERALPSKGKILLNIGEKLNSYSKIGFSKNSIREILIPIELKVAKN